MRAKISWSALIILLHATAVPAQQYMITKLGASQLYLVGYAAVFMVVLLLLPRGILPSLRDGLANLRERQRTRRPPVIREERAHA